MAFLAPLLLPLLALASVPIIIHLLNRRRFQLVDWAPMKYLKLTIKTNRRRLRIEQLILLAIRTLAVLILIFAVARPVLSQTGIGAWLGGRGRTSRLIVIDDSLSMGYQVDRHAAFEAALDATRQLVKTIGAQDSVSAFTTSNPNAPLVREAHLDDQSKLTSLVNALQLSDTRNDWRATFKSIDDYLNGATFPTRELVIVTDMRRSGWAPEVTETADRWAKEGVKLTIIDVGSRQTANTALLTLDQEDAIAMPGSSINLKATVRNDQAAAIVGAQAALAVGDAPRPLILPELLPGKITEVPISVNLPKPGQIAVRLSMPNDSLPQDDARLLNVNVRQRLDATLVDGEPSAVPFESETDYLAVALTVGAETWRLNRLTDAEFNAAKVGNPDLLIMANVSQLTAEQVKTLEKQVEAGMGLMIFAGDQVDASLYNERLYREGAGLLPAKLEKVVEGPINGLVVEKLDASPLEPLARITPEALNRAKFNKFLSATVSSKVEGVRVLAKYNEPEAHPAVIEKRFGRGRVLLFTMTADRQWTDWPIDPVGVLALRSAAAGAARADTQQDNLTAGQPIQFQLEIATTASEANVKVPGKDAAESAIVERPDEKAGPILRFRNTTHAGVYTLSWKDSTGAAQTHQFCVSPDKAESDLDPLSDDQFENLMGSLHPPIVHYTAGQTSLTQRGREIWRTLAATLLAMLAIEAVFAVWVGRER